MRIIKLLCLLFILSSCNKYLGVVDKDYIPTEELDDIFANDIDRSNQTEISEIKKIRYTSDNFQVGEISSIKIKKIISLDESSAIYFEKDKIYFTKQGDLIIFNLSESKEILKHIKNLKNKNFGGSVYVNRSDAKKMYFDFDKNKLLKELKKKLEKKFGKFYFNHIAPQLLISKFPVRLHADTGKNPDDVIFNNMIIVLDIKYKNKNKKKPPNTIIFGNRWYGKFYTFNERENNKLCNKI